MFFNHKLYKDDIHSTALIPIINWDLFRDKSVLITGATGLIGTFLIDLLMYRNLNYNNNISVFAVSRNKEKANIRFNDYLDSNLFNIIQSNLQNHFDFNKHIDFIIHGASNTHPILYSTEPINTILLSIQGTKTILDFASANNVKRILFLSTVEIYGENKGDIEAFNEEYCGYINCNTLRAGYTEGKRAAEALCQAFIKEKNLDIVIGRCSRVYGPTLLSDDSKAISQFIKNAVNNENIVLKSKGTQQFSYAYVADVCSALLFILLNGEKSNAYNITNSNENITLFEIAILLSEYNKKNIIFEEPANTEAAGFSTATKALLDCEKLFKLGWQPKYSLKDGLIRTIEILRDK